MSALASIQSGKSPAAPVDKVDVEIATSLAEALREQDPPFAANWLTRNAAHTSGLLAHHIGERAAAASYLRKIADALDGGQ